MESTQILKFSLSFYRNTNVSTADIDCFLLIAVEKQVEDLDLDLGGWSHRCQYRLIEYWVPQRLYSCSSITKLSLCCFCNLDINENVQWNQLKSLELDFVGPSSLGNALYRIFSGSPLLENLKLSSYKLFNIDIRSSSLKKLKIKTSYRSSERPVLRIWDPNLLSLEIEGGVHVNSSWDVPSLTDAVLSFQTVDKRMYSPKLFNRTFLSLCRVENVALSDCCILQFLLYLKREKGMVMHFRKPKFLQLHYGGVHEPEGILDILEIFPQLVMLIVKLDKRRGDRYHICGGTLPSPSLLQLKKVEISWFPSEDSSIFRVMEIMLQNAHVLEKMVFGVTGYAGGGSHLHEFLMAKEKVMRMPRSSPTSEVIILETKG